MAGRFQSAVENLTKNRGVVFAILIVALPIVIVAPLPSAGIDFLLTINIALGVLVLLTTIYVKSPLEFSVFPSLLLVATLYRLVLNIATTRMILTRAGTDGEAAAGNVIKAFGTFVAGDDALVGFILFVILVVVQFVVITKGATRISEVAARFTLDGMPGKQMAIDADLNSGLIDEQEARSRREKIGQEADFYGAMDGASKFVRGDAIAGIIITIINIVGGFILGTLKYDMTLAESAQIFTKLTVGDGLVSQVPAFIISVAAGLIVTRATTSGNLGEELIGQLLTKPNTLGIASVFLAILGFTGLPMVPMFLLAITGGGTAFLLRGHEKAQQQKKDEALQEESRPAERIESFLHVDAMELEVGYGLIRLVDTGQGGDLLDRITRIRRSTAVDLGIVIPPIRVRDNMQLDSNEYIIKIFGESIAQGEAMPDQFLAMDPGIATGTIEGIATTEPTYGLPATWITESTRERAQALGYTVVEPATVIATHLTEIIKNHSADLLTRDEVKNLLDNLKDNHPTIIEEVIPDVLKPGEVQKVLQNLLRERVSIRNLSSILETLGDYGARTKDIVLLTEYVRNKLARSISRQYTEEDGKLFCVTLDPSLEQTITSAVQHTEGGSYLSMDPNLLNVVMNAISSEIAKLIQNGHHPVVLVSPQIRPYVKQIADGIRNGIAVLSYNEVARGVEVESVGVAKLEGAAV